MSDIFQRAKNNITRAYIESKFGCPGAFWENGNYKTVSPLRNDQNPGSFSIREDGVFHDFTNGESGDIITLLARVENKTLFQVAQELSGETAGERPVAALSSQDEEPKGIEMSWMPIPEGKTPTFKTEPDYLTLFHVDKKPAFYVARYNAGGDDGKKLIYPCYWTGSTFIKGLPKSLKRRPLALFDKEKTVVLVEGEKCMEEAAKAFPQYAWTTWHGGAGVMKKVDLSSLAGCDVIIWPDNDAPGFECADHFLSHLAGAPNTLRRVDIPDQKPKGWDVADAIAEGFPVLELLEASVIIDNGYNAIDVDSIAQPREASRRPFTDLGNAERFADMWGHIIRYNVDKNKWLVWHEGKWKDKDQTIITPMVKHTIRSMSELGANEAVFWARKSESSKAIGSMLSLVQRERGIPVGEVMLDQDPYLLNCPNGVVDLRNGKLMEPDPTWLCTKSTTAKYNIEASCPKFLKFLDETFQEDPGVLNFVQRWIGYSITGDVSAQTFAIFHGMGANGKSTLVEVIQKIVGDYVRTAPPDTFVQKQAGGIPNDIAALRGARMVLTTETEANARLAEARVKSMTGGDRVSARYMRGEYFEFTPTWKITISTNHRPRISGGDYGIWRRIVLVPFNNVVTPEYQNPRLQEELLCESEGILRWAVQGATMWYQDHGGRMGLQVPEAVYAETQEYREDEDILGRFIALGCLSKEQIDAGLRNKTLGSTMVPSGVVYNAFKDWAESQGEQYMAKMTQTAFGRMMRERGYQPERNSKGRFYIGVVPQEMRLTQGERNDQGQGSWA